MMSAADKVHALGWTSNQPGCGLGPQSSQTTPFVAEPDNSAGMGKKQAKWPI
jgi:hypothetical protein